MTVHSYDSSGPANRVQPTRGVVSIVVLTHNRVHLLRQCVENVLRRTSVQTKEILIWNNASTDGTRSYLDSLDDHRIRIIHHNTNIGQNAYAAAFHLTSGDYLIELDDDVIEAPAGWDETLLNAFILLPTVGFLAANLEDDEHDTGAWAMHHENAALYRRVELNGIHLLRGPVGGGCAMTSREIHDRVGGFPQQKDSVFWLEDAAYIEKIAKIGQEAAYLEDLRVHHAGGPYYAQETPEKHAYWTAYIKARKRKDTIKALLLRLPFAARLNARFRWFQAPKPPQVRSGADVAS